MPDQEKLDDKKRENNHLIAEMTEPKLLELDINLVLEPYFSVFGNILSALSSSLLTRISSFNLESHTSLGFLQAQIDIIKDEIIELKQKLPSEEEMQSTDLTIPMNLLNYYQYEFNRLNSVKLVLFGLLDSKSELRVICDKSMEIFPSEERLIYKIELKSRKEYSFAKKISLILDGIPSSGELNTLKNQSFIVVNKFQEL